jgi:hypothetical protein
LPVAESDASTNGVPVIAQPPVAGSGVIAIHDTSATGVDEVATEPVLTASSGANTRTPAKSASARVHDRVFADFGEDLLEDVIVIPRTTAGLSL